MSADEGVNALLNGQVALIRGDVADHAWALPMSCELLAVRGRVALWCCSRAGDADAAGTDQSKAWKAEEGSFDVPDQEEVAHAGRDEHSSEDAVATARLSVNRAPSTRHGLASGVPIAVAEDRPVEGSVMRGASTAPSPL